MHDKFYRLIQHKRLLRINSRLTRDITSIGLRYVKYRQLAKSNRILTRGRNIRSCDSVPAVLHCNGFTFTVYPGYVGGWLTRHITGECF